MTCFFPRDIYYLKLDGFVSVEDMFTLTEAQKDSQWPAPAPAWLATPEAQQLGLARVQRPGGYYLREMPLEAFVCTSDPETLSARRLADYAVALQEITDGYEEGPNEEIEALLRTMIGRAQHREKAAVRAQFKRVVKHALSKHRATVTRTVQRASPGLTPGPGARSNSINGGNGGNGATRDTAIIIQ